jgi:hypothetical protein
MEQLINKLPLEVIYLIISFSYNIQNKDLLCDIKDIYISKSKILNLYKDITYLIYDDHYEYLLIYDLFTYVNGQHIMRYTDDFFNFFFRNKMLKSKNDIIEYILYMNKKDINTRLNIYWSLMTINEREDMINNALMTIESIIIF